MSTATLHSHMLLIDIGSLLVGSQKTSFRSVKEAMEAAQDGDQIILLPGIHNGMGYVILVIMCSSTCNLHGISQHAAAHVLMLNTLVHMALPLILSCPFHGPSLLYTCLHAANSKLSVR